LFEIIFRTLKGIVMPAFWERFRTPKDMPEDHLLRELQRYKREYIASIIRGNLNGRQSLDIFPTSNGSNTNEVLRQLLQQVISQFPPTSETFIGRQFPKGSYLEWVNPSTNGPERTLMERCYLPISTESFKDLSTMLTPVLVMELVRSRSNDDVPAVASQPIGMYDMPDQPLLGIYGLDIAQNLSLSYQMMETHHLKSMEVSLAAKGSYWQISLNAPHQVMFALPTRPEPTTAPSDLQGLLKAASDSMPISLD
jgi:hypothetical protein